MGKYMPKPMFFLFTITLLVIVGICADRCNGAELRSDINGDGIVDVKDFHILASDYGKKAEPGGNLDGVYVLQEITNRAGTMGCSFGFLAIHRGVYVIHITFAGKPMSMYGGLNADGDRLKLKDATGKDKLEFFFEVNGGGLKLLSGTPSLWMRMGFERVNVSVMDI